MGGSVTCTSELGQGAEFKIQLNTKCLQIVNSNTTKTHNDFIIISKASNELILKTIGLSLNKPKSNENI